jgi:hypothetical protein
MDGLASANKTTFLKLIIPKTIAATSLLAICLG